MEYLYLKAFCTYLANWWPRRTVFLEREQWQTHLVVTILLAVPSSSSERRLWRHLFVNRKNVAKCYVGFDPKGPNRLQLVTRVIPDYFW